MKKVQLKVGTTKAQFVGDYPRTLVDDVTSAKVNGHQFAPAYKAKRWDGKRHLLNKYTGIFPVGLLNTVVSALSKDGYEVEIIKTERFNFEVPTEIPSSVGTISLRPYQVSAIKAFLNEENPHPYVGILKMSVASGKTVTSAAIAKLLNLKTLFLVRGRALKDQTYEVYKLIFNNENVGKIDAKTWDPDQYTIASVDTLFSRLKNEEEREKIKVFLSSIQFLIVDEAHTATSDSFMTVLNCIKAPIRLGLSGTPLKKDPEKDLLLEAFCGSIVYNLTTNELQDIGHVSKAVLSSVIIDEPKLNSLDYIEAKDVLIIKNTARTEVIANIVADRYAKGKTIMVLAGNSVPLAENIHNSIVKKISKPKDAAFVYGQTDGKIIEDTLNALRKNKIKIITTTVIFDTGIDVPAVNCLFIANGGKSFVKTIQRIGRGLRKKEDGSVLEVVDVFDATNPYLLAHSKKRLKYYEEENLFESATVLDVVESKNETQD